MKKVKLNVKGMHCKSCEMLIKDSLLDTKGVKTAELDYKRGKAEVEFDEKILSENKIKELIVKEGYEVI